MRCDGLRSRTETFLTIDEIEAHPPQDGSGAVRLPVDELWAQLAELVRKQIVKRNERRGS